MANLTAPLAADVDMMNAAIGLEQEAIFVYKAAAGTKLLSEGVLKVALKIVDQHVEHEKALAALVTKQGGTPVKAKDKYDLPDLKTEKDILMLALKKEMEAANAYFDIVQKATDVATKGLVGSIMNDETTHVVTLASALGMSPFNSTSFMPLKFV